MKQIDISHVLANHDSARSLESTSRAQISALFRPSFTARASRSSGALIADNLADMVPGTNPFLKELLGSFLSAAGRARNREKRVDFDELGINEVVTVLREVPMDAVLRSFNASKRGDDPVIHFYEDFLKAYDKTMRAKRGVFYTPSPVVQFIVRSVDGILKAEFCIEDGLASTITWGEMMARNPELKLPKFCTAATPFVQVLDPATGTGTFIVEVIAQIHGHMLAKWAQQGKGTKAQWQPLWVEYVKHHLLPRLYAFELMMAPYAIAHMKIGLKLAETGYTFPEDGPRVNVFLTNALEPAHTIQSQLESMAPMLAHEAVAGNRVKDQLAATVVLGNPPYSNYSSNLTPDNRRLVDAYRNFRGQAIRERNQLQFERNIQDDFVKFISLAEAYAVRSGVCTVGYITNATMLSSPSLRGMREHLMKTFTQLYELHLHGGVNESFIDGPVDENVFEIAQAVSIHLYSRKGESGVKTLFFGDLWGSREQKYGLLHRSSLSDLTWLEVAPDARTCAFSIQDDNGLSDLTALNDAFRQYGAGVKTNRDAIAIAFDERELKNNIRSFTDLAWSESEISKFIQPIKYRPFDDREIFFHEEIVASRSLPTMFHMLDGENIGIFASSSWTTPQRFSVGVSKIIVEMKAGTHDRGTTFFPLYVMADERVGNSQVKKHNFSATFTRAWLQTTGLKIGEKVSQSDPETISPESVLYWLYAIFHSPSYRERFATGLAQSFPFVLFPATTAVFNALASIGKELVMWHLLEHADATTIVGGGESSVLATAWFGANYSLVKVAEKSRELADLHGTDDKVGKVFVNATSGFANVQQSIWQHTIGGYQVLHKWLDDRRKATRSLSQDDITHWLRVYAALQATQKLMLRVDEAIEANGGWPAAFSQNHPPPDAATLAAEQMVQKEQLRAQKKAITATKKGAVSPGPKGATSLLDFGEDRDGLAAASGAPPRPKSRATPAANAAGGKASGGAAPSIDALNDGQLMCAIRRALARAGGGGLRRDDLIRSMARDLNFGRNSPTLKVALDAAIRRAVRRGIAENSGGVLCLLVKDIDGYDRVHLKAQLLVAIRAAGGTCPKADAPMLLARALGFARTGAGITAAVESVLRSLIRTKQVESKKQHIHVLRRREKPA